MVSKEKQHHRKGAAAANTSALHDKLQLLRSVTNSKAVTKTSIIIEASNYIRELKRKVDELNQEINGAEQTPMPIVTVETLERGFLINVFSEKRCPGQLVSVLQAFEGLGLNVHEARVSCIDSFRLEAFGKHETDSVDAQMVKQAVIRAINSCRGSMKEED